MCFVIKIAVPTPQFRPWFGEGVGGGRGSVLPGCSRAAHGSARWRRGTGCSPPRPSGRPGRTAATPSSLAGGPPAGGGDAADDAGCVGRGRDRPGVAQSQT